MDRRRIPRRYLKRRKTWAQKCKDYIQQFVAFMFSNVGIIGLVVGYTIGGSFLFIAIEGPAYDNRMKQVEKIRNETADQLWETTCCTLNPGIFSEVAWRNHVHAELMKFQSKIVEEVQRYGYEGEDSSSNRWSFSGTLFYSFSVITTIGYGNVAPRTELGKLATVLYAIAGMPLFLLYLSNTGDILAKSFKWTYAKCCLCRGCSKRRRRFARRSNWQMQGRVTKTEDTDDERTDASASSASSVDDPQTVTVPITLCLTIMVGYVYGGAFLFAKWENWGMLDGSYFCFISLSTIGFGDIVPRDKGASIQGIELSFIFCAMYLMLGMALIAMCFNLMQEEVVHKIRTCGDCIRRLLRCHRSVHKAPVQRTWSVSESDRPRTRARTYDRN